MGGRGAGGRAAGGMAPGVGGQHPLRLSRMPECPLQELHQRLSFHEVARWQNASSEVFLSSSLRVEHGSSPGLLSRPKRNEVPL